MKLIRLTICRNEAWCIEASLRHSMRYCDAAVVLDHASTDDTSAILARLATQMPLTVIQDPDPVWREMSQRQRTLDLAREMGATHCAIIDADELLTHNRAGTVSLGTLSLGTIRDQIAALPAGCVLQPRWIHCWRSLDRWRDDASSLARAQVSFAFADSPDLHWTTRDQGYDFHHRHPFGSTHQVDRSEGGVFHLQHASWRRLLAKQALYQAIERIRWPERETAEQVRKKYAATVDETAIHLSVIPSDWRPPEFALLDVDAEPWQLAELQRLVATHPPETFAGLDFFGLV